MTVSRNEKRTVAPPPFVFPPTPQSKNRNDNESPHIRMHTGRFGSDNNLGEFIPNLDIEHNLDKTETIETQGDKQVPLSVAENFNENIAQNEDLIPSSSSS